MTEGAEMDVMSLWYYISSYTEAEVSLSSCDNFMSFSDNDDFHLSLFTGPNWYGHGPDEF